MTRTRIAIALTVLATAALFWLVALPTYAEAHVITPQACAAEALAVARAEPPATVDEWRPAFQACQARALRHRCLHPLPAPPAGVTVKHRRASGTQRANIARVLNVGRRMRVPRNVQVAAITAITQESRATNPPHGHGTSVGILQLINLHGSVAWRMVIENSAGWFYRASRQVSTRGVRPGDVAQRIQRSGHPTAYRQWEREAGRTYRLWLRGCSR